MHPQTIQQICEIVNGSPAGQVDTAALVDGCVIDSREAQDNYQVHERHEKFIETNKDNWATVRVFDSDLS